MLTHIFHHQKISGRRHLLFLLLPSENGYLLVLYAALQCTQSARAAQVRKIFALAKKKKKLQKSRSRLAARTSSSHIALAVVLSDSAFLRAMASRRAQVSAPASASWCSPWFIAVFVAFIGGISLGSLRSGSSALGWGAVGGASAAAVAAPMKRSKSAASAALRTAGKGRRRRRAAVEESGEEEGVAAAPAAAPAKEKLGIVPPPPKPEGEPFSLSFYDGKSITVRCAPASARRAAGPGVCPSRPAHTILRRSFRRRHLGPPPPLRAGLPTH